MHVFLYLAITDMLVGLVEEGALKTFDLTTDDQKTAMRTWVDAQVADYEARPAVIADGISLENAKNYFFAKDAADQNADVGAEDQHGNDTPGE